jgi:hypothetical protein
MNELAFRRDYRVGVAASLLAAAMRCAEDT